MTDKRTNRSAGSAKASAKGRAGASRTSGSRTGRSSPQGAAARARGAAALQRTTAGQRPFVAALVILVALVAVMALGPLQRYTAAADRVETLEATRQQLSEQVDRLEERRATLEDPEEVELIARTELGLVKPGEVPFIVVSAEDEAAAAAEEELLEADAQDALPWHRRLGDAIGELFGSQG